LTFTSLSFFAFVLATLILYYIIPLKFRWVVLLAASTAFYAIVCFKYLPFIVFTAFSTWLGGLWLSKAASDRKNELKLHREEWDSDVKKRFKNGTVKRKRLILSLILVLNFGILAVLKYYNFAAQWLGGVIHISFPMIGILLPLGISFYTFQSMGYIIDIYWEKAEPQRNFAKFALFVSFFPQIVQGPISIYSNLAGQLIEGHRLSYENLKTGFQLILWGLFKKMVIADRMVVALNEILARKDQLSNFYSLYAMLFYAFQLYMDFSGGIDIARGVARMLGIDMIENFRRPFFAKSVSEFWRRWHISLGNWLRTYLFYPIAVSKAFLHLGSRISRLSRSEKDLPDDSVWGGYPFFVHVGRVIPGCIATIITFFIIGMWHGADWKYGVYGLWNGIIIFISMLLDPAFKWILKKLKVRTATFSWRIWQIFRTFVLIVIGFAFDLGNGVTDCLVMIKRALTPQISRDMKPDVLFGFGLRIPDYVIIVLGLILVFAVSMYQERSKLSLRSVINKQSVWFQWVLMLGCILAIVLFGMYGPGIDPSEFVYMNF